MYRLLFTFGILIISLSFIHNTGINFNHKRIHNAIQKTFSSENWVKNEINNDSIFQSSAVNGKFFALTDSFNTTGYLYVGRVNSCRAGGCSVRQNDSKDFEFFDYCILFTKTGDILSTIVFNYQASHGQEICAKGWLKQFSGKNGSSEIEIGETIDAISGATISTHAIATDIKHKCQLILQLLKEQ